MGGTVILDFGGIPCMMMAGLNIRETPLQNTPYQQSHWATIHEAPIMSLRYLQHLLQTSGVPEANVVSIFYSKADKSLGKQTRTFVGQKKILERRALTQERPTIIFATPAGLQQFIQHLPQMQYSPPSLPRSYQLIARSL
jgi:hypothetical protein